MGSILLEESSELWSKINYFNEKVLMSLEVPDGVTHHEVFLKSNGELVFLEIGIRPPGAMVIEMVEASYGVNLHKIHLLLQFNTHFEINFERKSNSFWYWVSPEKGIIENLYLPIVSSDFNYYWKFKKGDELNQASSVLERVGGFLFTNNNYKELENDFFYAKNQYIPLKMSSN